MKVAILRNEEENSGIKWQKACEKFKIDYDVINLTAGDWFEKITLKNYNLFLLKPGGKLENFKQLYDERIFIISNILKFNVFPSYNEAYIYENKKLLSYFLKAKGIQHPDTNIFYNKNEAFNFVNNIDYPLVGKTSIGASGSGVNILKDKNEARIYINKAFSNKGLKRRFGPNRVTGSPKKWLKKAISSPQYLKNRLVEYISIYQNGQRGYVIFQEYISHEYEWRVVKIGESYFAHKKIKSGKKASGSKGIDYVNPPTKLLDFVKNLCLEIDFNSVAIDIFEHPQRGYLVNEIQTIFGHIQTHIQEVNGKSGRYLYKDNQWIFEEGDFNTNESYDLRLQHALTLFGHGAIEKDFNS